MLAAWGCAPPKEAEAPRPVASSPASAAAPIVANAPPDWAYPVNPPGLKRAADDGSPQRIAGSNLAFTRKQLGDTFNVADWRPKDHPPMPDIVARGRKPGVLACGYCHLPSGDGRPENARLAGLPRDYIIAQMAAFRSGLRTSAVAARSPGATMIKVAMAASDAEVAAAADYFASLKPRAYVRVVEQDHAPQTDVAGWVRRFTGGGDEPLGDRIVEAPEDFEAFERRDPTAKYVAYVPPGSIARGQRLVKTLKTPDDKHCADCHGEDMRGVGNTPGLAGRSPSYLFRQLHDFRSGARAGAASEKMRPVVQHMSNADMLAIVAYLATLEP